MVLVDYDSASDEESQTVKRSRGHDGRGPAINSPADTPAPKRQVLVSILLIVTARRKALPAVPSTYTVDPGDDPTQHQGRTRSRPFVPGELNAHVYLNLKISTALRRTLDELVAVAQTKLPGYTLHSLLATPTPSQKAGELHVSLTHPLPLRVSQVYPFRAELSERLRAWASSTAPSGFKCSLAGRLSIYFNGKATGGEGTGGRAFMALRLGAGAGEAGSIVDKAVHPLLAKYHLPLYHTNPEYHASFAWCLLRPHTEGTALVVDPLADDDDNPVAPDSVETPFSQDLLADLNRAFQRRLLDAQSRGGWDVSDIVLRVGKVTHHLPLS